MTWDLFARIANESASEPLLSSVTFDLHNEPLLDVRIFGWVQYFKSINRNKLCDLVTNGQLLDGFNLTDIMESNIDLIKVSLNAHSKETYQVMNEGFDYDKVMKNISYLLSSDYMAQRLVLSFVLTEINAHEVYQATRYWNERGVSTRVIGITNRAGSLKDYQRFKIKAGYRGSPLISRIRQYLMSRIRHVIGCLLPFYQMNILFNGDAIICCDDWARATVVGSIKNNTLREIWNSKKMNEVRQLLLKKRYQQLDSCNECSMVNRQ
jgi:radical SAM protein with 4Fe4S-binding SPASM domain